MMPRPHAPERFHSFATCWVLAAGMCLSVSAHAQGPIRVDRFPVILEEHFSGLPSSMGAKGFDIVATDDTVVAVVYLRNDGGVAVTNVVASFAALPGLTFPSSPVSYGTILPGATVARFVHVLAQSAPVGVHGAATSITADNYAGQDTTWLFVWEINVSIQNLQLGLATADGETPFTRHHYDLQMPEVFEGGLPAYFLLQSTRDSITFLQPFYGVHWGDPLFIETMRPTPSTQDKHVLLANFRQCLKAQDSNGNPIAGATMTITHSDGRTANCVTGANGECCIENVPPGEYVKCCQPPGVLEKFYSAKCETTQKVEPPPGHESFTKWIFPPIPPKSDPGKPGNAQDGPPKAGATLRAGAYASAIGIIADLLATPTGAGTGYGVGSMICSLLNAAKEMNASDPDYQDVSVVGEENTPPANPAELTLAEVVSATVTFLETPYINADTRLRTQFQFTRFTDADTYVWAGQDTIEIPQDLFFQVRWINPVARTYEVAVRNAAGSPLPGSTVLPLCWVLESNGDLVPDGFALLHDDGIAPDVFMNDGKFSGQVPVAASASASMLIAVTRTGFDSLSALPSAAMQDVLLASIVGVDAAHPGGSIALGRPWPNPSQSIARMAFTLPRPATVSLWIFDAAGRAIRTIVDRQAFSAGEHSIRIDTSKLGAGQYSCRMEVQESEGTRDVHQRSQKLVVIR